MKLQFALLLVMVSWLAGCHHDEGFLSLAELCPDRVEAICNAQSQGCCMTSNPAACEDAGMADCLAQQDALTAETGLTYDAVAAQEQEQAAQALLNTCMPPPALATYFKGGLPLGSACARASQCASGNCTGQPLSCTAYVAPALCQ